MNRKQIKRLGILLGVAVKNERITITLWIVAGVAFIVALALLLINYNKSKKHQVRAEVYEIDNLGRVIPYYDKYGIIFNKVNREKMGHLLKGNLMDRLKQRELPGNKTKKLFRYEIY